MSSLGHMSPSLLQKLKGGLRPRPPKPPPNAERPSPPAEAAPGDALEALAESDERERRRVRHLLHPSWILSTLFHMILLLGLALLTLPLPEKEPTDGLAVSTAETAEELEETLADLDITLDDPTETEESFDQPPADVSEPVEIPASSQVEVAAPESAELIPADFGLATALPPGLEDTEFGEEIDATGELGAPVNFLGSKVRGRFAVVFDITGSMFHSVQLVLKELDTPMFKDAQVVAVFGATFKRWHRDYRLVPYRSNVGLHEFEIARVPNTKQKPLRDAIYTKLSARQRVGSFAPDRALAPKKRKLQSLGAATEALLSQTIPPRVIFIFSDFMDGVDKDYMRAVQQLAIRRKVKIVVYHPKQFKKDRDAYKAFAEGTGGELREDLPQ